MKTRSLAGGFSAALLMSTALVGVAAAQETGVVQLEDVIVSATPLLRTTDELATPVTVLEDEEITSSGATTIGELLKDKPGISHSAFAPGASRPIIRGLDNFRIRIQENGIGSHDVSAVSEDHTIPIDPFSAERIEVIRGPATLLYGSEAIGGVVSVLNNRIPQYAPENGLYAEAFGSLESVDDGRQGGVLAEFGHGRFVGHLDAFARKSGDYDTPNGEQENSHAQSSGASAGGSVLFENGYIGASAQLFEADYGIPGGEAAEEGVFIDLRQVKVNAAGEVTDLGSFIKTVRGRIGYSDYTHDEVVNSEGVIGATFFNEQIEGRAEFLHAPIGGFEGAVGFQAGKRELSAGGEASELISPATGRRFAMFIFEEVKVTDGATLQLGGRVEHVNMEGFGVEVVDFTNAADAEIDDLGSDRDLTFTPVSASAAVIVDLVENTTVGLSLQYSERAPALMELFSKGAHEATATFEIGDPTLGKEKALSVELTAKRVEGPFRFEAAAFHTSFKDYIYKRITGNSCGEEFDSCEVGFGEELTQVAFTAEDATFIGAELGVEWDAFALNSGVLGFDGQFDVVSAEFDTAGDVPRIPPMRIGAGVFYKQGGFYSRLGFLHAFEQDDVGVNETTTSGYTDVSAKVSYTFDAAEGEPKFEIGVVGSNLLDDEIRNHTSFKKDEVLQPGASARVYGRIAF